MKASAMIKFGMRMSTSIQFQKKQRQYIIHEDDDALIYNLNENENENENKNKNKNTNNFNTKRDKLTYTNRTNTLTNTNTNTAPKPKKQNLIQENTETGNRTNIENKLGRITRREQKKEETSIT